MKLNRIRERGCSDPRGGLDRFHLGEGTTSGGEARARANIDDVEGAEGAREQETSWKVLEMMLIMRVMVI